MYSVSGSGECCQGYARITRSYANIVIYASLNTITIVRNHTAKTGRVRDRAGGRTKFRVECCFCVCIAVSLKHFVVFVWWISSLCVHLFLCVVGLFAVAVRTDSQSQWAPHRRRCVLCEIERRFGMYAAWMWHSHSELDDAGVGVCVSFCPFCCCCCHSIYSSDRRFFSWQRLRSCTLQVVRRFFLALTCARAMHTQNVLKIYAA